MNNPADEAYAEGDYAVVTIKARRVDGVWEVYCPEWRCTLHDKNLTRVVSGLCAEIEIHNERWATEESL